MEISSVINLNQIYLLHKIVPQFYLYHLFQNSLDDVYNNPHCADLEMSPSRECMHEIGPASVLTWPQNQCKTTLDTYTV